MDINEPEIKQEEIAGRISALKLDEYELSKEAKDYMRSFKKGNASLKKIKIEVEKKSDFIMLNVFDQGKGMKKELIRKKHD